MLDTDAPITPGVGLGGIEVGCPLDDILSTAEPLRVIELPDDGDPAGPVTIHSFGAIRVWSVQGIVEQVGAFEGYAGRTAAGIGIGSTLAEVAAAYGEVVPLGAEGMVQITGAPGVGIETTEWATGDEPDPAARVVQIFVHAVDD